MSSLLLVGNPRRRKARKARTNTAKRRTRRASATVARTNPAKRRRAVTRHNPIGHRRVRHHRRARRNPIAGGLTLRSISETLKSAAIGASGAVAFDVGFGLVKDYLPASLSSPVDTASGGANYGYFAAKGAFAIAAGLLLRRFMHGTAGRMVEGSLTVTIHDLAKQFISTNATSVPMGRFIPGGQIGAMPVAPLVGSRRGNVVGLGRFIRAGADARRGL